MSEMAWTVELFGLMTTSLPHPLGDAVASLRAHVQDSHLMPPDVLHKQRLVAVAFLSWLWENVSTRSVSGSCSGAGGLLMTWTALCLYGVCPRFVTGVSHTVVMSKKQQEELLVWVRHRIPRAANVQRHETSRLLLCQCHAILDAALYPRRARAKGSTAACKLNATGDAISRWPTWGCRIRPNGSQGSQGLANDWVDHKAWWEEAGTSPASAGSMSSQQSN